MYRDESIYIAGPECFYPNGFQILGALRRVSESYGFRVSLPNDRQLKLDDPNPQRNADVIFDNCAVSMNDSTAIIADLETFRGTEPDGGTIYEIGMAFAKGLRCYAYTRDKRSVAKKVQHAFVKDDQPRYPDGSVLPHPQLPFSPCVVGSCKIVEGSYHDALTVMMQDIDEERKLKGGRCAKACPAPEAAAGKNARPQVYLAGLARFCHDDPAAYDGLKAKLGALGCDVVTPFDWAVAKTELEDPLAQAYNLFDNWQQHVRDCDILIGELSDYHGLEPSSDVSFECGMAWQLGKKCVGVMSDTTITFKRIPHYSDSPADVAGSGVENFNYPLNLMFSSSMPIVQGEDAAVEAVKALLG